MPSWVFFLLFPLLFKFIDVKGKKIHSSSFIVRPVPQQCRELWLSGMGSESQMWGLSGYLLSPQGSPGLSWLRPGDLGLSFPHLEHGNPSTYRIRWLGYEKPLAHGDAQEMFILLFFPHLPFHLHTHAHMLYPLWNISLLLPRCTPRPSLPCSCPSRLLFRDHINRPLCPMTSIGDCPMLSPRKRSGEGNGVGRGTRKGWG